MMNESDAVLVCSHSDAECSTPGQCRQSGCRYESDASQARSCADAPGRVLRSDAAEIIDAYIQDFGEIQVSGLNSVEVYGRLVQPAAPTAEGADAPGREYITNCVQCGRIIDTREADEGGDTFGSELFVGSWVCSSECWDAAVGEPDPTAEPEGVIADLIARNGHADCGHARCEPCAERRVIKAFLEAALADQPDRTEAEPRHINNSLRNAVDDLYAASMRAADLIENHFSTPEAEQLRQFCERLRQALKDTQPSGGAPRNLLQAAHYVLWCAIYDAAQESGRVSDETMAEIGALEAELRTALEEDTQPETTPRVQKLVEAANNLVNNEQWGMWTYMEDPAVYQDADQVREALKPFVDDESVLSALEDE